MSLSFWALLIPDFPSPMAFRKPIGGSANGPAGIIKEGDPLSGSYYIPSLGTTSVQGFPGRAHLLSRGRAYPAQCHPDAYFDQICSSTSQRSVIHKNRMILSYCFLNASEATAHNSNTTATAY